MIVNVEKFGDLEFTKASDGWYECKRETGLSFAIDPDMTICRADPWYADYIADAPIYKFTVSAGQ